MSKYQKDVKAILNVNRINFTCNALIFEIVESCLHIIIILHNRKLKLGESEIQYSLHLHHYHLVDIIVQSCLVTVTNYSMFCKLQVKAILQGNFNDQEIWIILSPVALLSPDLNHLSIT